MWKRVAAKRALENTHTYIYITAQTYPPAHIHTHTHAFAVQHTGHIRQLRCTATWLRPQQPASMPPPPPPTPPATAPTPIPRLRLKSASPSSHWAVWPRRRMALCGCVCPAARRLPAAGAEESWPPHERSPNSTYIKFFLWIGRTEKWFSTYVYVYTIYICVWLSL